MGNTFLIAKILNIEIRADPFWAFGFGAFTWALGSYYLPTNYPALSSLDAWSLAVGVTTFIYVSVAAHELGHSIISRRLGVPVDTITLYIFGGLAHLKQEPKRARDEFLIAIAGPAVSFLFALGFGSMSWLGEETIGLKLYEFTRWVGLANLSLAVFNLIPGFPLDGGRVLRSIIWGITGNFERATQIAALMGMVMAYGLMMWGGFHIIDGGITYGIWIILIAWFLTKFSSQYLSELKFKYGLAGLTVREVLQKDAPAVPPMLTIQDFVNNFAIPSGRDWFLVSRGGRVTGLVSTQEIQSVERKRWTSTTVGMVMRQVRSLPSIQPDESVYDAFQRMRSDNLHLLHVFEGETWLGSVTREGILSTWRLRSTLKP